MIVERVRAGVARAKVGGTRSGKAFGRPRTSPEIGSDLDRPAVEYSHVEDSSVPGSGQFAWVTLVRKSAINSLSSSIEGISISSAT